VVYAGVVAVRRIAAIFARYAESTARSRFVICPRGLGPSSIRIFEAMRMGRCPVIVSDDWTPPSFVDWNACSIRVAESAVRDLPAILREREADAASLGAAARAAWERLYSPSAMLVTLVESCVEVACERPTSRQRSGAMIGAATTRESLRRTKKAAHRLLTHTSSAAARA
jgi:hypothetical protein